MFDRIKQKARQSFTAFKKAPYWQKLQKRLGFKATNGQGTQSATETKTQGSVSSAESKDDNQGSSGAAA